MTLYESTRELTYPYHISKCTPCIGDCILVSRVLCKDWTIYWTRFCLDWSAQARTYRQQIHQAALNTGSNNCLWMPVISSDTDGLFQLDKADLDSFPPQIHFRFFDPATDRSGVLAARRRSSVPVAPGASAPAEAQDERCVSAKKMNARLVSSRYSNHSRSLAEYVLFILYVY